MNERDDRNREQRTPDEQRALAALRTAPPPVASEAARTRARAAFIAEAPPVRRRGAPRTWLPLALAAVLVVAVIAAWQWTSHPRFMWTVTDVTEPAGVAAAGGTPMAGMMVGAGPIRTAPGSEVELQLGQELRFRLLGDGDIELPEPPRRWPQREVVVTVKDGEIFGTTAGEGMDVNFRVRTPEVEAHVIGTTFAVFQNEDGTCVCLLKGTIKVTPLQNGEVYQLPPESKFYVYKDGSRSEYLPLDQMELMKLRMMADAGILPVVGKD